MHFSGVECRVEVCGCADRARVHGLVDALYESGEHRALRTGESGRAVRCKPRTTRSRVPADTAGAPAHRDVFRTLVRHGIGVLHHRTIGCAQASVTMKAPSRSGSRISGVCEGTLTAAHGLATPRCASSASARSTAIGVVRRSRPARRVVVRRHHYGALETARRLRPRPRRGASTAAIGRCRREPACIRPSALSLPRRARRPTQARPRPARRTRPDCDRRIAPVSATAREPARRAIRRRPRRAAPAG